MQATADSLAFAPPPEPAAIRGFALAVLAHLLLMAALAWGITWNRETTPVAVEAELWSAIPKEAAPKPVEAPPVVKAPPVVTPPPPVRNDADIAIEREKQRQELERQREAEEKRQLALEKKKQEAAERKQREQEAKLAKLQEEREKKEFDKQQEKRHKEQVQRMQALAGATGSPNAAGSSLRSKGPSASYAGRIAARIKPNIVFTEVITGNPSAEVEIRVAPDGTIVGIKLLKSSGVKAWDDAVVRAVEKTSILPKDTDGTVVPEFPISFRPRD